MTQEKVEQNQLIVELRDTKGWSWGRILDELNKRGFTGLSSPASVKMKYYAVKKRKKVAPGPRHRLRQPLTSPSTSTVTPQVESERKEGVTSTSTSTRRMTFWLPGDMIREIKARAKGEKRTASDILREVLGEYLKNK